MAKKKKTDQMNASQEPEAVEQAQETVQEPEAAERAQEAAQEPEEVNEEQEIPKEPEQNTGKPEQDSQEPETQGAPAGAQWSGSGGERKKETADMELSANAGSGMEQASSDAFAGLPDPCVYCGPSVKGVARQYTTYQGGLTDALREFVKKHPIALGLIVSTGEFPAMRRCLEKASTPEAKLYKAVKERL